MVLLLILQVTNITDIYVHSNANKLHTHTYIYVCMCVYTSVDMGTSVHAYTLRRVLVITSHVLFIASCHVINAGGRRPRSIVYAFV